MNDSGYDETQPLLSKRAAGYDKRFDGSYVNTSYIDMTQPYAGGSLYSTVDDLFRWDQAFYTEKVLTATSKDRMFTPGLSNYGYGWTITKPNGVTTIAHGGGINGFNTLITRNPESKRVVVLLNNTGGAPLDQIADGIRAILDGKEPVMPKQPAAPLLFKTYQSSGLAAALAQAKELQAGTQYDASSGELSRLAGQLLATGKAADALELAKKLAEESPRSAGTAVLLARAHRANGNRIEAVPELLPRHRAERDAAPVPSLRRRHQGAVGPRREAAEVAGSERPEVLFVSRDELIPRVVMGHAAEVFQRIGGGHASDLRAHAVVGADGEPLHEAAAERVADTGRILDAMRLDRRHVDSAFTRQDRAAVFAAGHHQERDARHDVILVHARLLAQQLEFVVVADHHVGAVDAARQLIPVHPRALLPRVPDVADSQGGALFGVLDHRLGIVRRHDDETVVETIERPERQLGGVGHRAV